MKLTAYCSNIRFEIRNFVRLIDAFETKHYTFLNIALISSGLNFWPLATSTKILHRRERRIINPREDQMHKWTFFLRTKSVCGTPIHVCICTKAENETREMAFTQRNIEGNGLISRSYRRKCKVHMHSTDVYQRRERNRGNFVYAYTLRLPRFAIYTYTKYPDALSLLLLFLFLLLLLWRV